MNSNINSIATNNISKQSLNLQKERNFYINERRRHNICKDIQEVIEDRDLYRGFLKVVKQNSKYNYNKFREIIIKIQNKDKLNTIEEETLIEFFGDMKIDKTSKRFYGNIRGFNLESAARFKAKYPISTITAELKKNISQETEKNFKGKYIKNKIPIDYSSSLSLGTEYTTTFEKNFNGERYCILSLKKNVAGEENKDKMCIKKEGELVFAHDFIYDHIYGIAGGDTLDTSFCKVKVGEKQIHKSLVEIENPKNTKYKLFDSVERIQNIDNNMVYLATIGDKQGYVRVGHEKEDRKNVIFDLNSVTWISINPINGKHYYKGNIGNKEGYFDFDTPITKQDIKRLSKNIEKIETDKEGNVFYKYGKKGLFSRRQNKHFFIKVKPNLNQTKKTKEEIKKNTEVKLKNTLTDKSNEPEPTVSNDELVEKLYNKLK